MDTINNEIYRENFQQHKSKYKINYYPGCVMFKHVACSWMCVLFYVSFVCLHVCACAFKFKVHCWSAFELGASGLPYYCTPPVCVPDVIGALAVWRQNNKIKKDLERNHTFLNSWYKTTFTFYVWISLGTPLIPYLSKPKPTTKKKNTTKTCQFNSGSRLINEAERTLDSSRQRSRQGKSPWLSAG